MSYLMQRMALLAAVLVASAVPGLGAEQPTIYLTFDDGPLIGTANALSVIQEEKVPAGFFMVGKHVDADTSTKAWFEAVKAEPLVTLADHSFTHANDNYHRFYSNGACVVDDMRQAVVRLGIQVSPVPARLPGRNTFRLPGVNRDDPAFARSEHHVYDAVGEAGFHIYGWDLEWLRGRSAPRQSPASVVSEISGLLANGKTMVPGRLLLLMHDQMFQSKTSREMLVMLIKGLKKKSFTFGRIEHYLTGVTGLHISVSAREPALVPASAVCDPVKAGSTPEAAVQGDSQPRRRHGGRRRHRKH